MTRREKNKSDQRLGKYDRAHSERLTKRHSDEHSDEHAGHRHSKYDSNHDDNSNGENSGSPECEKKIRDRLNRVLDWL